jgi:hypothetical protein
LPVLFEGESLRKKLDSGQPFTWLLFWQSPSMLMFLLTCWWRLCWCVLCADVLVVTVLCWWHYVDVLMMTVLMFWGWLCWCADDGCVDDNCT